MDFKNNYERQVELRAKENVPPLPLNIEDTKSVIELLKNNKNTDFAKDLLLNRVSPGVDDSAKIKAEFLGQIIKDEIKVENVDIMTFLIYKMYIALMFDWSETYKKLDDKVIADSILKFVLNGISRKEDDK